MTNKELVEKAKEILALKTIYLHGAFGAPLTEKNKDRYCKADSINIAKKNEIYACSSDTFGFDCIGMIKGILWGFSADQGKTYGGATYKANGVPDVSADGMITKCSGVSTDFSNIVPGAYLYMKGHCGIYIGDGYAIECTNKWNQKVMKTVCANHPENATGYGRKWISWGKLPYIEYVEETPTKTLTVIINDGKTVRYATLEKTMNVDSTNYGTLREIGDLCGYKVSYDKEHKCPRFDRRD